jgi:predicted nucleic acid-binding protein
MSIFIDTSAFLAVLDADDTRHASAREAWIGMVRNDETLITSNYVLVETLALIQHRLGMEAVLVFQNDVFPVLEIIWVDESLHAVGVSALLAASRRRLSLVDCVSFEAMRRSGAGVVFAFDPHFAEQGFACIPQEAASAE